MDDCGLKLYTMDTNGLSDETYYKECYGSLSAGRREKIDRQRFPSDKRLSLGAGLLMDKGLREYGLCEAKVRILRGENGKPYLPDYPHIHFNLAHSGNMAMAVFAEAEVGCDIEKSRAADLRLAKRFFCPGEYGYLAGLEGREQDRAFVRLWTLKESFLKVTGMGIRLPLDSFSFQISKDGTRVTVEQSYDHKSYRFFENDYGDCHAAVCIQEL